MVIRPARQDDVPSIIRLWREMWDFHASIDLRFEAADGADEVVEHWIAAQIGNEASRVLVAEGEGGVLEGYCLAMVMGNPPVVPHPLYGYISEIAVHRQREGVGTQLLAAADAWFRAKGIPYVETSVAARNAPAREFWRKRGYAPFLERLRRDL